MSDFTRTKPDERAGLTNHIIQAIDNYIRKVPTYKEEIYEAESEVSKYLFDLTNYCDEKGKEDES